MGFSVREYRTQLFAGLGKVHAELRCAFAAACGERLAPYFVRVHESTGRGDPKIIAAALQSVWDAAGHGTVDQLAVKRMTDQAQANIFEDGSAHEWAFAADHCAAAVAYALMALSSGKAQDAGWAGVRLLDAMDAYLQRQLFPKGGILTKEDNQRLWEHPLFQAEVSRQLEDLAELQQAELQHRAETAKRIRARAQKSAASVFSG